MRRFARIVLAISVAGLLLMSAAGSAVAHSALEASDPAAGAVLAAQPATVTLTFNEPVELNDGAIKVFDDTFNRVDMGHVTSLGAGGNRLQVGLRPGLPQGTYTVSWHASSADTHPVSGSFQFSVGHLSVVSGTVPDAGSNDLAGLLLGVLRWTGYLGLMLGPGVLLVGIVLWPAGLADRRFRRLTLAGLSLLAISTAGTMFLQGVWASGQPISALWSAPEKLDTHSRRFDEVYAVRSLLLVGFAAALVLARSTSGPVTERSGRVLMWVATVSTVALIATWPLVGHSAIGDDSTWAIAANLLHTFAMTIWLGGLALALVCLRPPERAVDLAMVLPRFSRLALAAVATLVTTGTFMAWREVGSLNALTATTYGRVLLVKLLGVLTLVLLGNAARLWVKGHVSGGVPAYPTNESRPSHRQTADRQMADRQMADRQMADRQRRVLWRGLIAEATIALGVLAATAALVVIVPAR